LTQAKRNKPFLAIGEIGREANDFAVFCFQDGFGDMAEGIDQGKIVISIWIFAPYPVK
jgi:hypothetical protein